MKNMNNWKSFSTIHIFDLGYLNIYKTFLPKKPQTIKPKYVISDVVIHRRALSLTTAQGHSSAMAGLVFCFTCVPSSIIKSLFSTADTTTTKEAAENITAASFYNSILQTHAFSHSLYIHT